MVSKADLATQGMSMEERADFHLAHIKQMWIQNHNGFHVEVDDFLTMVNSIGFCVTLLSDIREELEKQGKL